mgnify:CR=1 FL=1
MASLIRSAVVVFESFDVILIKGRSRLHFHKDHFVAGRRNSMLSHDGNIDTLPGPKVDRYIVKSYFGVTRNDQPMFSPKLVALVGEALARVNPDTLHLMVGIALQHLVMAPRAHVLARHRTTLWAKKRNKAENEASGRLI